MTSLLQRPDPVDLLAPERRRAVLTVAVVGGVALGIVDLLLQLTLPYPWANLANSSAMWALLAFGYGIWVGRPGVRTGVGRPGVRTGVGRPGVRTGVGGALLLVVGVVSYYLAAALLRGDDVAAVWAVPSLLWAAFGVIAGVPFALAGSVRGRGGWWTAAGAAIAGGVCFAEFVVDLLRFDAYVGPGDRDLVWTAVLVAGIGLAVLLAAARTVPVIGRALLASVPLAAIGVVGFAAAGFTPGLG